MWSGDKGVVSASNQRFDFNISHWQGDMAPKPDMEVLLTLSDGCLAALNPITDAELIKEKFTHIGEKGNVIAKGIINHVGNDIVGGYIIFAIIALTCNLFSGKGMFAMVSIKLTNLLSLDVVNMNGGTLPSSFGVILVLIATATIVVPFFWKHKYAPLAFCAPFAVVLIASYKVYAINSSIMETTKAFMGDQMFRSMNQYASQHSKEFSKLGGINYSLFTYLLIAASIYLLVRGVMKYRNG